MLIYSETVLLRTVCSAIELIPRTATPPPQKKEYLRNSSESAVRTVLEIQFQGELFALPSSILVRTVWKWHSYIRSVLCQCPIDSLF